MFSGELQCLQSRQGYRFSLDAVLLANFMTPSPAARVLDLGAGCGIVSLILAFRRPDVLISAIEIQPGLASLARKNSELNGFAARLELRCGDLRRIADWYPAGSFDCVLSNPPFRKILTGRCSRETEQAVARHEIAADLGAVMAAASYALKTGGRLALIYPAARAATLFYECRRAGIEPKRLRLVHSHPGGPGRLVLVEGSKGGGEELTVLPPLYVYKERGGAYSEEMADFYRKGA